MLVPDRLPPLGGYCPPDPPPHSGGLPPSQNPRGVWGAAAPRRRGLGTLQNEAGGLGDGSPPRVEACLGQASAPIESSPPPAPAPALGSSARAARPRARRGAPAASCATALRRHVQPTTAVTKPYFLGVLVASMVPRHMKLWSLVTSVAPNQLWLSGIRASGAFFGPFALTPKSH